MPVPKHPTNAGNTGASLSVGALLRTVACTGLLFIIGLLAGMQAVEAFLKTQLVQLEVLNAIIAVMAFASGLALFAKPRIFVFVALAATSLFLWETLYVAYAPPDTSALFAPVILFSIGTSLLTLLLLPGVTRIWLEVE